MREKDFDKEVIRSLCALPESWAYKIPDVLGSRFMTFKPFDIVATICGHPYAIENKQIKKWQPFGVKEVRTSQIINLEKFHRAGGTALIFLNVRITSPRVDRLIIFEWRELAKKKRYTTEELKALPFVETYQLKGEKIYSLRSLTNLAWREF